MSNESFVHLHTHTHYSLLKSSCTVPSLVDKSVEYSQPAVAITDYGNMLGVLELYFTAKERGIKPLLGLEIYLSPQSLSKNIPAHISQDISSLVLIAKNMDGYRNLCRINTQACLEKDFYNAPHVNYEVLRKYSGSVIALTGGLYGNIARTFLKKGAESALRSIRQLKEIYHDRLYLQLNRNFLPEWDSINSFLVEASRITGVPLVAGGDVHYLNKSDHIVQDVLMCIGDVKILRDPDRFKLKTQEFYFKSSKEMRELFQDLPEACDNTLEISEMCQLNFHLKKEGRAVYHLPRLSLEEGVHDFEKLKELSHKGLQERWAEQKENLGIPVSHKYIERLEQELKIIIDMGFTGYFLIVHDFVHWAREQNIPVGPGRGSGASSLVAYCLRITDLDPMTYHLLFERFLNPARISLPDFDIDFCQENRNRVIEYVSEKYGKDYVAQVMTYGRLQARAAIRDVGRVLGISYIEVDQLAKMIPDRIGITLSEAIRDNQQLRETIEAEPQMDNLIKLARQIEGLVRHVSIHAAGVIIADHPIVSYAPLYRGVEGKNVIQCDLQHSKKIGLVKFDFLGLKTLTQIHLVFKMVKKDMDKEVTTKDIALDNKHIYEIMCQGDTKGVFQFEGEGITDLIVKAQPSCFEDIVAINALFRPGPMDMIPSYLDRKKGKLKVQYIFPELESILKETYGIIVYQEQVLLIAARIAGYSYSEADILRRAMGEKKPSVMQKQKNRFLSGAKKNNYNLKKAEKLFDLMAEFANYGFNKSHAVAYCVLAAQTAWLKYYYPCQFFSALLTVEMNNTDKMIQYVRDAHKHGITVLPPHINHSDCSFVSHGRQIYFSLGAIKGVGLSVVEHIVSVRNTLEHSQKFSSVQEFFEKIDTKKVSKKTVEALVKAGALDGFEMNRREILENYDSLLSQVENKKEEKSSGQINLFATEEESKDICFFRSYPAWSSIEQLKHEKVVLGFYLSDHPMNHLNTKNKRSYVSISSVIQSLEQKKSGKQVVCVGGIIDGFREVKTRKGTYMGFARLEDNTGTLDLVVFSDIYSKVRNNIRSDNPLFCKGTLKHSDGTAVRLVVQDISVMPVSHSGAVS